MLEPEFEVLIFFFVFFDEYFVIFLFFFMLIFLFFELFFEVLNFFFILCQVLALGGHGGLELAFHDSALVFDFLKFLLFEIFKLLFFFFHLFLMLKFLFFEQVAQISVLFSELVEFLFAAVAIFGGLGFSWSVSLKDIVELGACQVHAFDHLLFFLPCKHVELGFGLV
jgi:hypothetical protein